MRFRHKKTGAIIDVPSKLGGNWEPMEGGKTDTSETATPAPDVEANGDIVPARKSNRKTTTKSKMNK